MCPAAAVADTRVRGVRGVVHVCLCLCRGVARYSPHAAYNTTLRFPNGSSAVLYRRERPKPVFNRHNEWVGLFNGAWPCHVGAEGDDTRDTAAGCQSYTLMTAVGSSRMP